MAYSQELHLLLLALGLRISTYNPFMNPLFDLVFNGAIIYHTLDIILYLKTI